MALRRSKENKKYWNKRVDDLFELAPEMSMVEKKYDSLKLLLQQKYPFIKEQEDHIQFLKDVVYLDRLIRLKTEGQQVEEKELLEQEYIIENLQ